MTTHVLPKQAAHVNNNPQPPLWHALDLAKRGIATFPMGRAKAPLKGSHGVRDATTDPTRLAELFADRRAELVAIATGQPSGISVLDVDQQHNGLAWWLENRNRLPSTWAWRTRSGGLHIAMKHRPELRTAAIGQIGVGIEIRSTRSSAIYWPCVGLPTLCDAPPAEWPSWLLPPPRPASAASYAPQDARPPHHVEASLAGLVRNVATAGAGQRNARLHWSACRAAEMTSRGEIARRHAEAVLIEAASRCGLDHREAATTIASAYRAGGR
jgi:hypothetical protein